MDFPWNVGLVKQVKDIFVCEVLECEPLKEEEKDNGEKHNLGR